MSGRTYLPLPLQPIPSPYPAAPQHRARYLSSLTLLPPLCGVETSMHRVTRGVPRAYVCHELVGVPQLSDAEDPCSGLDLGAVCPWGPNPAFGELEEGTDIEPTVLGGHKTGSTEGARLVWDIPVQFLGAEGVAWVRAAAMVHTVPCVGYVIQQDSRPGALDAPRARAALSEALKAGSGAFLHRCSDSLALGPGAVEPASTDVNKLLGVLKKMSAHQKLQVGDHSFCASDFVGPATAGPKLTLMGDTALIPRGSSIEELARDSTCLVHEATDMYLPGCRGTNEEETAALINARGHSTPSGAGEFARRVGARTLVLTHFSQKHQPSDVASMSALQAAAVSSSGLPHEQVICGRDLVSLKICPNGFVEIKEP